MIWFQWIAPVIAVIAFMCGYLYVRKSRQVWQEQQRKLSSYELLTKRMVKSHDSIQKQLIEIHSANHAMMQRVAELEAVVEQTVSRQNEIVTQDPDSRLYTRAVKMVELGADIQEVMKECELPRAEAELLYTLHGKPLNS
ncbi:DUF2802 domain-containing protein [Celerinatantimonas sp. YJH-8]|uniref:DUF2802 domain-containing protein n=1 Tax=Celerinatantimonas sp. YJH-8 TaxID=3228714 RepID=UPI0038C73A97